MIHGVLPSGDNDLTSFVGVGPATPPTIGGWTLLTADTGNTMIHAIPLSNGQILIMERPGNRESPVRTYAPFKAISYLILAADVRL